jgi:hypothetical protein
MKIDLGSAELSHAVGRTNRHDEVDSRFFFKLCESA